MFHTFVRELSEKWPGAEITLPVFEPVVSGLVSHGLQQGIGVPNRDMEAVIRTHFHDFLYRTDW